MLRSKPRSKCRGEFGSAVPRLVSEASLRPPIPQECLTPRSSTSKGARPGNMPDFTFPILVGPSIEIAMRLDRTFPCASRRTAKRVSTLPERILAQRLAYFAGQQVVSTLSIATSGRWPSCRPCVPARRGDGRNWTIRFGQRCQVVDDNRQVVFSPIESRSQRSAVRRPIAQGELDREGQVRHIDIQDADPSSSSAISPARSALTSPTNSSIGPEITRRIRPGTPSRQAFITMRSCCSLSHPYDARSGTVGAVHARFPPAR